MDILLLWKGKEESYVCSAPKMNLFSQKFLSFIKNIYLEFPSGEVSQTRQQK